MRKPIRVGVVGASPDKNWASHTHLPALQALPQYQLHAVSTTRRDSADRAAQLFGAPLAFDDALDLVNHPDIDLVTVAVKVPEHREIVLGALAAGKHVYCEWPLGRNLRETMEIANAARTRQIRTVVGLQGRLSPWLKTVRELVDAGRLGRILSTSVIASAVVFGETSSAAGAYMLDRRNGATMATLSFAHLLDSVLFSVGKAVELSALQETQRKEIAIVGTDERMAADGPDQIIVNGLLDNGGVMSMHMRGGSSQGTNLLWEINGTEGDLTVGSDSSFVHLGRLTLSLGNARTGGLHGVPVQEASDGLPAGLLNGPACNVAHMYAQLARDLDEGTHLCPSFEDAVGHHRILDLIQDAAREGRRMAVPTV